MDARGHRRLMAEVSGEVDELDPRILLVNCRIICARCVAAAVVDEDRASHVVARRVQRRGHPPAQLRQVFLLVEDGDDD